jgi:glycosyltransferase involved in cell wall biosynthesis
MMRVSLITACYNSSRYISSAIESIINQDYAEIEYIIIDGASTDGTIDIVKSYGSRIAKFISEPDNGIYDAMNKGLRLATGNIIGILNSDDLYVDNSVISLVVDQFEKCKCDALYADLYYVKQEQINNIVRKWKTRVFSPGSFRTGWHPPHPGFFVRKEIYDRYGIFDLEFKLAADFELMLRFLEKYKIQTTYLPQPLIRMRLGGATNKSIKNILFQNIECYKAFKKNKIPVSVFYPFLRLLPKLVQFLK